MDERIEAFLKDVLRLQGENSSIVDEGVRRLLAKYESNFANAESDERMKEKAAEACKALCRSRVFQEIPSIRGRQPQTICGWCSRQSSGLAAYCTEHAQPPLPSAGPSMN
jgi:hypothetical protein